MSNGQPKKDVGAKAKPRGSGSAMGVPAGPKGIATLSMLKVNFDAGRDHIDMFLPFVLDAASEQAQDDFIADDIQSTVRSAYGLQVPLGPIQTMLGRAVKKRLLKRQHGRYFKTDRLPKAPTLTSERQKAEAEVAGLATGLRSSASERGITFTDDEDALSALMEFLEQFHVAMILDEESLTDLDSTVQVPPRLKAVARYLLGLTKGGDGPAGAVARLLEGYILQNVLTLRDVADVQRRFAGLHVFLDTQVLSGALGFRGEAEQVAVRDGLDLMVSAGIRLGAFEDTIYELKTILKVYESHLGTAEGIRTLRPYAETRFFVENHYSPSDVRAAISTLEKSLKQLGIRPEAFPEHDVRYTLDESRLSELLLKPGQSDPDPRVWHDVNCTAAVLSLRRGRVSAFIEQSKALFATSTGQVVDKVRNWYREQDESGVPPVVHIQALLNVVWLKRPSAAPDLKIHQLVVLCEAALKPSRETWMLFQSEIGKQVASGTLKDEESVALIVSGLTEAALTELEYQTDVDATTVSQVIARVKAEEERRLDVAVRGERAKARAEVQRARREAEESSAALAKRLEAQEAELRTAQSRVGEEREKRRQVELRGAAIRGMWARWLANAAFFCVAVLVAAGLFVGLPEVFPTSSRFLRILGWAGVVVAAILAFLNLAYGVVLVGIRDRLRQRIAGLLRRWFG